MPIQRACANTPVLPRRAVLTGLAASPIIATSVTAKTNVGPKNQTSLEKLYLKWQSARSDVDEALTLHPDMTKAEEIQIFEPLWERADRLEENLLSAPCEKPSDLGVKFLVAFADWPDDGVCSDSAVEQIKSDVMKMVNLSDVA